MNESRPNGKSPYRPMVIMLVMLFVVPLILCGGLLTWFFGRQSAAANALAMRAEQYTAAGIPVDDAGMSKLHRSLTSDRHSDAWAAVGKELSSDAFGEECRNMPILGDGLGVPPAGDEWPDEERVQAFLTRWDSVLKTIRDLSLDELDSDEKPLRRKLEFDGIMTLLNETQEARQFARLLLLKHDVALRNRDGDTASEYIRAMQGLRRSFDGEPLLISQLVGIAIGTMSNDMLRRSLEADVLSEEQLKEISGKIARFDKTIDLHRVAAQGERASTLPIFTDPDRAKMMLEMEGGSANVADVLTKLRSRDGIFYLDEMDKIEHLPDDSMKSFLQAATKWEADLGVKAGNASTFEKMDHVLSYLTLPAYGAAVVAFVREAESNNLARQAIAVRLFQYRFGRWPETVDELEQVGMTPLDWETAGDVPFGWIADADGVVVWGVDRSTEDEIPAQPPTIESEDDRNAAWVWRIRADQE